MNVEVFANCLSRHIHIPGLLKLVSEYASDDRLDRYERKHAGGSIDLFAFLTIAAEIGRVDAFRNSRSRKEMGEWHKLRLLYLCVYNASDMTTVMSIVILTELRTNWGLTAEDARSNNNDLLRCASKNGPSEDARMEDNYALRWAAGNGHVAVLLELRTNWGLTRDDARADDNCALRWVAESGSVAALVELRIGWGLTGEDARAQDNMALWWANYNGHIDVVEELHNNWGLIEHLENV